MWRGVIAACGVLATWCAHATAQPQGSLGPPAPDTAMRAFAWASGFVRGAEPERVADEPVAVPGACIVLRIEGERVGFGVSFDPEHALRQAATQAAEAMTRAMPQGRDVVQEELRRKLIASATMSLELAGPLVPIRPETFAEVDAQVEPGLEGVAVRRGEGVVGAFPGWSMGAGMPPSRALQAAVCTAMGDPNLALPGTPTGEAGPAGREHGLTFYKFAVTHLAQTRAGGEPVFLYRGGRVVEPSQITRDSLRWMADSLAEHLIARLGEREAAPGASEPAAKEAGGFEPRRVKTVLGTYQPATGQGDDATVFERSLAAYALGVYARRVGVGSAQGTSAVAGAHQMLPSLRTDRAADELPWRDPAAAAMLFLAVREVAACEPGSSRLDPDGLAALDAAVASLCDDEGVWRADVPGGARGLGALALAARARDARDAGMDGAEGMRRRASAAVRAVFRETNPARLVSQMPWLGQAEVMLAGDQVPSAAMLRDMRDMCWTRQVPPDAGPDALDLAGGLSLAGAGSDRPTWHGLRPVCFLAAMLGDARLTDDKEVLPQTGRLLASLRYVRQLMVDESSAYNAVERDRALGGVRTATWEASQPIEASALALLTVEASQKALDAAACRLGRK